MIRSFEKEDLCEVLQLWLSVNLEVHSFVKESYWLEHRDTVAAMMLEADIYVWEEQGIRILPVFLWNVNIAKKGLEENFYTLLFKSMPS